MENYDRKDAYNQSLNFNKESIEKIKKTIGLANDAEHCGYLIHIEKSDEFLAYYEDDIHVIKRRFSKTPEHAIRFNEISDAIKLARSEKGEEVVMLFDAGNKYIIFGV